MNLPRLGTEAARLALFPLAPEEEQQRIVTKVDELMTLCDKLEEQQQERERRFPGVSAALNAQFVESPTNAMLNRALGGILSVSPDDLRLSLLALAAQGKLVQQEANDEPASDLVSRIFQSKGRCAWLSPVREDEQHFSIPDNWVWERLGNVTLGSDSGWSPKCESHPRHGFAWGVLKVSAVSWGAFLPDENKALPAHLEGRPECEVRDGDFLISRANTADLVARSVVVRQPPPRLMMSDKIVRFKVSPEVDTDFLNLVNSSHWARAYYAEHATGTSSSMKNVGRSTIAHLPIAIPPIAEQQRIIARVRELMSLIDQLEARQREKDRVADAFAQAAVAAITGTATQESKPMKAPKTELVTRLEIDRTRNRQPGDDEPLARLLAEHEGALTAKALWQRSGLSIDAFYQQLRTEMAAGWILEPEPAQMREVESD